MFSLFSKKNVTIESVSIPDFGWPKVKENKSIIQWVNPDETIAISINYFDIVPNIPTLKDVNVLKGFYRNLVTGADGGVVEVVLYKRQQFNIIRTIFKIPQMPSGMTYVGSLTIPFSTCSFVLKIQAVESGATGMREAIVVNKLLSAGNYDEASWSSDPYDKEVKTGRLMNKAEDQSYDDDFPNHPLSQVRNLLSQIEEDVQWQSEVEKLRPFEG